MSFLASVLRHIYRTVVDAVDELSGVNDIETLIERTVVDAIDELSGVNIETLYKIVVGAIDELSGVNIETLYKIVVDIIDELSGVSIETLYKIVVDAIDELSGVSIETLYKIVVDAIDELSGLWVFFWAQQQERSGMGNEPDRCHAGFVVTDQTVGLSGICRNSFGSGKATVRRPQ